MLERLPRTHRINADLHCHSVVSDGTLKPENVVERAHRNRVEILALTDHDEVAGLAVAQERARQLGMAFVPGVEVSDARCFHIDPVMTKYQANLWNDTLRGSTMPDGLPRSPLRGYNI